MSGFKNRFFSNNNNSYLSYYRTIRRLLKILYDFVKNYKGDDPVNHLEISKRILISYANSREFVRYAEAAANKMIDESYKRNRKGWESISNAIFESLNYDLVKNPVISEKIKLAKQLQVTLLQSLPLDLARQVSDLSFKARVEGLTSKDINDILIEKTQISYRRAATIARTETSRASSLFTQITSTELGSVGYFWKGTLNNRERKSHRELEGKFIYWDDPPTTNGMTGHAGQVANCHCISIPYFIEYSYKEQGLPRSFTDKLPQEIKDKRKQYLRQKGSKNESQ